MAKAKVDHLVVLVGYKPTQQVAGHVRAGWIRLMHPDVEVIEALEDIPNASAPWAKRALELLQGRIPDVAFTSEAYGESWAALMGARHVTIDLQRARFAIFFTPRNTFLVFSCCGLIALTPSIYNLNDTEFHQEET